MTHRDPLLLSAVAGHSRVRVERAGAAPDIRMLGALGRLALRRRAGAPPCFPPVKYTCTQTRPTQPWGWAYSSDTRVRAGGSWGGLRSMDLHGWHRDEGRSAPAAPRKLQFLSRYTFMLRILAGLLPERVHSHRQNAPAPLSALAFIKDSNIMFCAAPVLILRSTFTDSI